MNLSTFGIQLGILSIGLLVIVCLFGLFEREFRQILNALFALFLRPFLLINDFLRNKGTNSVLQTGFTFDPPINLFLDNHETESITVDKEGSQLDLFLTLWEQNDSFRGYLEYSTNLFRPGTVKRFTDIYKRKKFCRKHRIAE